MRFVSGISLFILSFATSVLADVVFSVDFENRAVGLYTNKMAQEDFPKKAGVSSWYAMEQNGGQNAKIVQDDEEHGMVLQLKYPKGCVGPNDEGERPACAGQVKQPLNVSAEEMWVAYDIQFEPGFEFVKGGKLPGLCGGECYTGGNRPSVGDGWSARIMWRANGAVVQYLYFVDQASTYGDDAKWNLGETAEQKHFVPGKWHRVVTRVVMNSVSTEGTGDKNGIVQSWFDGELALDLDTLRLRDFQDQKIDEFYLSTFHGGDDDTWAPSTDVFVRYDNFVVSTDSINVKSVKPGSSDEGTSAIKPAFPSSRSGKRSSLRPSENSKFFKNDKDFNAIGQQL
ncbi:polysaccharide lyase [Fibrobacter sp. UWH6]|uniref:polysaccharide lyase n=1 Tax=Fibrobacter sp. (strain UWH6) TaxID=1896212 RepID=UPI00091C18DC|nr:alginate lyase [Fibrobacter sp. UWH6]SHL81494.1 hypothetical protein SAMN05720765_1276 [Fibrobacter sp. UWH6]